MCEGGGYRYGKGARAGEKSRRADGLGMIRYHRLEDCLLFLQTEGKHNHTKTMKASLYLQQRWLKVA